jgi:Protein of unknown function (DUF1064)
MSNNLRWTPEQLRQKGLVEHNGSYVPVKSLVQKGKVEKLPSFEIMIPKGKGDAEPPHMGIHGMELEPRYKFCENGGAPIPIHLPPDYVPIKNIQTIKSDGTVELVVPKGKMKAAIKTEVDGIRFDSRLEAYMYTLLRGSGLTFEMQKEYVLQLGFKYNGEAVRPIKIVVDFYLISRNILIDTKGFQFRDGTIKYKMLKWLHRLSENPPTIIMPKDKKECDILLNKLLYGKQ